MLVVIMMMMMPMAAALISDENLFSQESKCLPCAELSFNVNNNITLGTKMNKQRNAATHVGAQPRLLDVLTLSFVS